LARERAANAAEQRRQRASVDEEPEVIQPDRNIIQMEQAESARPMPSVDNNLAESQAPVPLRRPNIRPEDLSHVELHYLPQDLNQVISDMQDILNAPDQIYPVNEESPRRNVRIIPAGAEDDEDEEEESYPDLGQPPNLPPLDPTTVHERLVEQMRYDSPIPPKISLQEDADQTAAIDGLCDFCEENVVNTAYYPCGHAMWCYGCATREEAIRHRCPNCGTGIISVLHLRGKFVRGQLSGIDASTQTESALEMRTFQQNVEERLREGEKRVSEMTPKRPTSNKLAIGFILIFNILNFLVMFP
jgi:hypothetical protein